MKKLEKIIFVAVCAAICILLAAGIYSFVRAIGRIAGIRESATDITARADQYYSELERISVELGELQSELERSNKRLGEISSDIESELTGAAGYTTELESGNTDAIEQIDNIQSWIDNIRGD